MTYRGKKRIYWNNLSVLHKFSMKSKISTFRHLKSFFFLKYNIFFNNGIISKIMKSTHKIQLSVILTFIFFNYRFIVKILFEILHIVSNNWTVVSEYPKLIYEEGREKIRLYFNIIYFRRKSWFQVWRCRYILVVIQNQSICK